MKIILYTITDCQFSKQEKEYLQSHNLAFEEKNLETNREFLTEMLTVSNNFAGTPVTKIEKDDGQIVILKGFTAADFDKTFGFTPPETPVEKKEEAVPVPAETNQPAQSPAAPAVEQPATQAAVPAPVAAEPAPIAAPPVIPVASIPDQSGTAPDPMANILNNLAQQAQAPVAAQTPSGLPSIPDPQL